MNKNDRRYRDATLVLDILETAGYSAKLAGGCVRDRLLGKKPADFDIATAATPEQVMAVLRMARHKVVPTGLDHGTVTAVMKHGPVEITTLRQDKETDGRHAVVAFSDSFEEDASRRDFTINAMFEDRTGNITDFFSGQQHLAEKRLAFVGDPTTRICEDYLRILRLFRFWGQLDFIPDAAGLAAAEAQAPGLKRISQERKTSELWKLLRSPHPRDPLKAVLDSGIINYMLAGFPVSVPDRLVQEDLQKVSEANRPLGWLLWLTGAAVDDNVEDSALASLADELKLSNADKKTLVGWLLAWRQLAALGTTPAEQMGWIDDVLAASQDTSLDDFSHTFAHAKPSARHESLQRVQTAEAVLGHLRRRPLPLSGTDVQKILQIQPGPQVGQAIEALKTAFRNGEWQTSDEGEHWLLAHHT